MIAARVRAWGRDLGDDTLTAAIFDRLAMHAIRIASAARATGSTSPGVAPSARRRPELDHGC
jgi:hypothetical protein